MSNQQGQTNRQKAVAFFGQPVWSCLLEELYKKYIARGQIGGQVVLRDVKVALSDFQKALAESAFACTLPDLLQALFPERPLITNPRRREATALSHERFRTALFALADELPDTVRGKCWLLYGAHGLEALFSRYKNGSVEVQEQVLNQVRLIILALNQLPAPHSFERLAPFAQRMSGDPHFFDLNTLTGRLFLHALTDLSGLVNDASTPDDAALESKFHDRMLLYYDAGLLLDTISSTITVFHLISAEDQSSAPDRFLAASGERILILPLRQVLAWKKLWPASRHVYIFENPQVFEEIVDALLRLHTTEARQPLPTLICTAGWPSVAAIRLLHLLVASQPDIALYYSGDFDVQGLRIAAHLMRRYPSHCRPWHFDPASYLAALHSSSGDLGPTELDALQSLPENFAPLVSIMREQGKKAYQEGIIALLLADIRH
jgi:uncharacterized protein (TIGR02679 family)